MFEALNFVLDTDLQINPIDYQVERRSGTQRLYNLAIQKERNKEDEARAKELERMRKEVISAVCRVKVLDKSKRMNLKNGLVPGDKSFYDYSVDWMRRKDRRVENERTAKDRFLKAEEEREYQEMLERIAKKNRRAVRRMRDRAKKEAFEEKLRRKRDKQRLELLEKDSYCKFCRSFDAMEPKIFENLIFLIFVDFQFFSIFLIFLAFQPKISDKSKGLKRQGKIEERLIEKGKAKHLRLMEMRMDQENQENLQYLSNKSTVKLAKGHDNMYNRGKKHKTSKFRPIKNI